MKPGFIFDLDGTLADSMPTHFRAWQVTCAKHGLTFDEKHFYELGGVPTLKIAAMLIERAGLALSASEIAIFKEQAFLDSLDRPGAILPIAPVVEIARARRAEGPLAIASGGRRRLVERTLGLLGIGDWFSAVVTAEDTERHKPEPDVFLEAARRIGVPPEACTVYEDTDTGIEAARRANMKWVDVRSLYHAGPGR